MRVVRLGKVIDDVPLPMRPKPVEKLQAAFRLIIVDQNKVFPRGGKALHLGSDDGGHDRGGFRAFDRWVKEGGQEQLLRCPRRNYIDDQPGKMSVVPMTGWERIAGFGDYLLVVK